METVRVGTQLRVNRLRRRLRFCRVENSNWRYFATSDPGYEVAVGENDT
jgi:hypothetical protein